MKTKSLFSIGWRPSVAFKTAVSLRYSQNTLCSSYIKISHTHSKGPKAKANTWPQPWHQITQPTPIYRPSEMFRAQKNNLFTK